MQEMKPIPAEIKARGRLTIPKKILRQTGLPVKELLAEMGEERGKGFRLRD